MVSRHVSKANYVTKKMGGNKHTQHSIRDMKPLTTCQVADIDRYVMTWTLPEKIEALDREPFGPELAQQVADKLALIRQYGGRHCDYCGIGMFVEEGVYYLADVFDGYPENIIKQFGSQKDFTSWLQQQSDYTMSGHSEEDDHIRLKGFQLNNQCITRASLLGFISD
eukprot:CAMPEP_0202907512 /NCGR_PEP_ID=MMETSP1392-20130828/42849_1 /ASSEMBLY_ACC=CAM_ASM_000868 /TAXON_ID=225041 /ORGANISM="Chlamydomonas chlamydogama, Strain SAG 11-48b" /LENGTH=166 /DNA_ID=CAMNT_0049596437 /DNA_START=340 /DNA_END=840 /DNA_ORIENTATION=-